MARFTARFKRAFLREIYESGKASAVTLPEALTAASRKHVQAVDSGYLISSVSSAGHSTSFFQQSNLSPMEFADLAEELYDRYAVSAAALGYTSPTSAQLDEIFADMVAKLTPVRTFSNDFSTLRVA